jgi:hypothetical protein
MSQGTCCLFLHEFESYITCTRCIIAKKMGSNIVERSKMRALDLSLWGCD